MIANETNTLDEPAETNIFKFETINTETQHSQRIYSLDALRGFDMF